MTTPYTLETLRELLGGVVSGDGLTEVVGVGALESAVAGQIAFADHRRHLGALTTSGATAFVVPLDFPACDGRSLLRVDDPRVVFARIAELFVSDPKLGVVHPDACVDPAARLGPDVSIGACAVIEAGASLGARTVVLPGTYVGRDAVLGGDCCVGPNATLMSGVRLGDRVRVNAGAVIGGDGFGFVWSGDHHRPAPRAGTVQIDDDVEVGCNTCIDRATLGVTRIRRGAKLDNLVQVAHNCELGADVILTGQVGIAGSSTVGDRTMLGGQAGVIDHVTIGSDARVGAGTLVTQEVKDGQSVWGLPGRELARVKRERAALSRLPELRKLLRSQQGVIAALEERLARLERASSGDPTEARPG